MNSHNFPVDHHPSKTIVERREAEDEDDSIDIWGIVNTVWRGKWLIVACTVIAGIYGIYSAYIASVPVYRATAVVILETNQSSPIDLQNVVTGVSGDSVGVKTEIEVLRARSLMGRVVDRLDLTTDPEFNGALRERSWWSRAKGETVSFISNSIRAVLGVGSSQQAQGVTAPTPQDRTARVRDNVVSSLLRSVQVQNVPGSLVFRITSNSTDARKAALIADTIAEQYIINQIDVKFEAMEQATSFLSNRAAELKDELELAEAKIAEFNAENDLVSIEIIGNAELELTELRSRAADARMVLQDFKEVLQNYEAAETVEEKVAVAADPRLSSIAATLDADPDNQQQFDMRFQVLLMRVRQNFDSAAAQVRALSASESTMERRIAEQSRNLISLQQLSRDAEATRLLYEYFLTRLKEISAQQGIQQADSRILSKAVVPGGPYTPRKRRTVLMAMTFGGLAGIGIVLLLNMRRQGFKTADELEAHTGYSVLGQIPVIKAQGRPMVLEYLRSKPTSAAAEAVRDLRTSIMLSNIDNPPRVIVSTSSLPGEGKTTQSLALAQNLSAMGEKVLLVEGDIRRRTLNEYFVNVPEKGIVSVLLDDVALSEAIMHDDDLEIDVLFGEKSAYNAADIFSSAKFKQFIDEQKQIYNVIIIDTPPVLVVPDARIISQVADVTLLSVKWDSTTKYQLDEALRLFRNSRQGVSGLVLSQVSAAGMRRYGYGDKYGAYAGYGNRYYNN